MLIQRAALVFGIVFILVGVLGFVVTGGSMDADPATAPRLLGLFPVNVLHNVVHLALGVWGLIASRAWGSAKTYCLVAGALYLVLAGLGFVAPDLFGLVPIGGNDIALHAVLGSALLVVGATAGKNDTYVRV
ncbi:MAG TPA: DUF4383 domain-containing protein [Longimicrobiales bacterium]|nr:DUF4383 domain-containing protein [Longimicrobiales bacterium]